MFRKITAVGMAILFLFALCACTEQPSVYEKTGSALGSAVTLHIYGSENAAQTAESVFVSLETTDSLLSANNENSDIYKLNRLSVSAAVSKETLQWLGECLSVCHMTGEVLDITVGAVSELWGFDTQTPHVPDEEELQEALQTVDMNELLLDGENLTVASAPGQKIDLTAFINGIAVMRALPELHVSLAPAALTVGSTTLLYGKLSEEEPWTVGILDPKGTDGDICATLALTVQDRDDTLAVSMAAVWENAFTENGKTYHRILDKTTGMPVENEILSVSVVSAGGFVSDALSDVLFIHGLTEQSLQVLENYAAEAVFVLKDGRILVSDGLQDKITLTNDTYSLANLKDAIN